MLIYVDKKKEKQKKRRRICLILFCLFLIVINVFQFKTAQQHSLQSLTTYSSIKHLSPWFNKANTVHLLISQTKNNYSVLCIPTQLNRENTITTALALSKLPQKKYQIYLAQDITEKKLLTQLINLLHPSATITTYLNEAHMLITTDYQTASSFISNKKLFPTTLNYKHAQKLLNKAEIKQFIKQNFPSIPTPQNKIEKEQTALQLFIDDHLTELQNFIFLKKEPSFALQNFFLQNIRLCLKTTDKTISCALSEDLSFKENLHIAQAKLPQNSQINTLYLLTSDNKISPSPNTFLKDDEGLHFKYQNSETILLPEEIKNLENKDKIYYALKEKAGYNPLFNSPQMIFYKFKIKEIRKDEEI